MNRLDRILLIIASSALLVVTTFANAQTTAAQTTTAAPTTPVPAPLDGESVNPFVIGFGVLALLALFGASFYFVVVWPKRSLLEYRKKFEALVNRDRFVGDETSLRTGGKSGESPLYGGAKPVEIGVSSVTGQAKHKKIPTMKELNTVKAEREAAMAAKLRALHEAEQNEDDDI